MNIIYNYFYKQCIVCLDKKYIGNLSFCKNCKHNGIVCHSCHNNWIKLGNNPWRCFICRDFTKTNVLINNNKKNYNTIFFNEYIEYYYDLLELRVFIQNSIQKKVYFFLIRKRRKINIFFLFLKRFLFIFTIIYFLEQLNFKKTIKY